MIPTTYEAWRRCITVDCGIPLTASFIDQRLRALRDPTDFRTKRFIEHWGADHHARVVAWFEQAKQEVAD